MPFDLAELLRPLGADDPCGASLRHTPDFKFFLGLGRMDDPPPWSTLKDRALDLVAKGHDVRAWVWVCRAGLAADGVPGLAAGLELLADGLSRFWAAVPPLGEEGDPPGERYLGRLMALGELGITSERFTESDLARSGRLVESLKADLAAMPSRAPVTPADLTRARDALAKLEKAVRDGFGPGHDPQLGTLILTAALDRATAPAPAPTPTAPAGTPPAAKTTASSAPLAVDSREDVVRALDLVLAYYRAREPASPVPLLLERAKRLVPLGFLDAVKDLAPTGLKELMAVAGTPKNSKDEGG